MLYFYSNTLKTGNCCKDRRFLNKSSPAINWYHDGTNPLTINTGPNKPFPKTQSKFLAVDLDFKYVEDTESTTKIVPSVYFVYWCFHTILFGIYIVYFVLVFFCMLVLVHLFCLMM